MPLQPQTRYFLPLDCCCNLETFIEHSSNERSLSPFVIKFLLVGKNLQGSIGKLSIYLSSPTCRRALSGRSRAPITAPRPVETFVVGGRARAGVGSPRNPLCTTASSREGPSSNLCPSTIPARSPTRSARSARSDIRCLKRKPVILVLET